MAIDIEKAREHFMRSQFILNDIDEDRIVPKGSLSEKEQKQKMKKIYLEWEKLEQQYMDYNLQILQHESSTRNPSRRPSMGVGSVRSSSSSGERKKAVSPQQRQDNISPTPRIGKVYFVSSPPPEFEHSKRTDRSIRRGSFHIQQLLYMYRVFTRTPTKTTYLHVYGITSERNVYLRINREYFDEVTDLELASLIFESPEDNHDLLKPDADASEVGYTIENVMLQTRTNTHTFNTIYNPPFLPPPYLPSPQLNSTQLILHC